MKKLFITVLFTLIFSTVTVANEVCEKEKNTAKLGTIIIVMGILHNPLTKKLMRLQFIRNGTYHNT